MFKYFNPNPQASRVGDCSVRAMCKALDLEWDEAYLDLCIYGLLRADLPSANHVWGSLLKNSGFRRFGVPNSCPECYTVEQFCREHAECQKLAILYTVKNGLEDGLYNGQEPLYSYAPEPEEIKENYILGEFGEVFENAPHQLALDVLEEHMQLIKAVYPKEYAEVIRRLKS